MKKTVHHRSSRKIIPFRPAKRFCPNAKRARYYVDKLADWGLAAVTSMGAVVALSFLIML